MVVIERELPQSRAISSSTYQLTRESNTTVHEDLHSRFGLDSELFGFGATIAAVALERSEDRRIKSFENVVRRNDSGPLCAPVGNVGDVETGTVTATDFAGPNGRAAFDNPTRYRLAMHAEVSGRLANGNSISHA
jgi:hypothetical protein